MTRLPRRPTWFYRTGAQITTAEGAFEVIVTGAADLIWRQWAPVRKPLEPVTWTINGEPLYAHQLPPEEPSDER